MRKILTKQEERLCMELYDLLREGNDVAIFAIVRRHPHMASPIFDLCAELYPYTIVHLMDMQQQRFAPCLDLELAEDMTWEVDGLDEPQSTCAA